MPEHLTHMDIGETDEPWKHFAFQFILDHTPYCVWTGIGDIEPIESLSNGCQQ
jgi:hypothetical protein